MAIAVERSPRAVNWIERVDDLSGGSKSRATTASSHTGSLPRTVLDLLAEAGRTYAPFMIANAAALDAGADEVVCEIDGHEYRQGPFGYQGKCLKWLRDAHAELDDASRATVDGLLAGTGCDQLFA